MSDDKNLPVCGIIYCPMGQERRFFGEASENLRSLPSGDYYKLRAVTLKLWCHGHKTLAIEPDLARCRFRLDELTRNLTTPGDLAPRLRAGLAALEREESGREIAPF